MELKKGTRLGPYRIDSVLGSGGMGTVYRAEDTRLDRLVAIKVLRRNDGDASLRQRFQREAKAISSLNHPNICALYDVGSHNNSDYLVMEYLDGETLRARLRKGLMPYPVAVRTAIQIADALTAAHTRGIVHRDLKPDNVLLSAAGHRESVKVADLGLALPVNDERISRHRGHSF